MSAEMDVVSATSQTMSESNCEDLYKKFGCREFKVAINRIDFTKLVSGREHGWYKVSDNLLPIARASRSRRPREYLGFEMSVPVTSRLKSKENGMVLIQRTLYNKNPAKNIVPRRRSANSSSTKKSVSILKDINSPRNKSLVKVTKTSNELHSDDAVHEKLKGTDDIDAELIEPAETLKDNRNEISQVMPIYSNTQETNESITIDTAESYDNKAAARGNLQEENSVVNMLKDSGEKECSHVDDNILNKLKERESLDRVLLEDQSDAIVKESVPINDKSSCSDNNIRIEDAESNQKFHTQSKERESSLKIKEIEDLLEDMHKLMPMDVDTSLQLEEKKPELKEIKSSGSISSDHKNIVEIIPLETNQKQPEKNKLIINKKKFFGNKRSLNDKSKIGEIENVRRNNLRSKTSVKHGNEDNKRRKLRNGKTIIYGISKLQSKTVNAEKRNPLNKKVETKNKSRKPLIDKFQEARENKVNKKKIEILAKRKDSIEKIENAQKSQLGKGSAKRIPNKLVVEKKRKLTNVKSDEIVNKKCESVELKPINKIEILRKRKSNNVREKENSMKSKNLTERKQIAVAENSVDKRTSEIKINLKKDLNFDDVEAALAKLVNGTSEHLDSNLEDLYLKIDPSRFPSNLWKIEKKVSVTVNGEVTTPPKKGRKPSLTKYNLVDATKLKPTGLSEVVVKRCSKADDAMHDRLVCIKNNLNFHIKIENAFVNLLGAPDVISDIEDLYVLLQIVDETTLNSFNIEK